MGGTWVWLNDLMFATDQVLLRDGTVLRRIWPSGRYEILNPAGIFTITRTPNPEDFGFHREWPSVETTVVAHTGEVIISDDRNAWRREPVAGSWSPMSMPPTSVLDPEHEWLHPPGAQLSDGRILFLVDKPRYPFDHPPLALLTVDQAGGWRRYPLEGLRYMIKTFIMLPGESSHMLMFARAPRTDGGDVEILTVEFAPETGRWTSRREIPIGMDPYAGLLLPDGDVLILTGWSTLHRYSPGSPGPWSPGISLPPTDPRGLRLVGAAPSLVLLPSGRVLLAATYSDDNRLRQALVMFEYDPDTEELTVSDPELVYENPRPGGYWHWNMLLLPSGSVLASFGLLRDGGTWASDSMLYRPDPRPPRDAWRPVITTCPETAQPGDRITITGRRFGGRSQALTNYPAIFWARTVATNYPIVRATALNGAVSYWRTISPRPHWIGNPAEDAFQVVIPRSLLRDATYRLEVIVNGIPSLPRRIRVTVPQDPTRRFLHSGFGQRVFGNLADGAAFVITDSGIRPVPGWDTGTRQQVEQLNRQFLDAAAQLYALGQAAVNLPAPQQGRPDAKD